MGRLHLLLGDVEGLLVRLLRLFHDGCKRKRVSLCQKTEDGRRRGASKERRKGGSDRLTPHPPPSSEDTLSTFRPRHRFAAFSNKRMEKSPGGERCIPNHQIPFRLLRAQLLHSSTITLSYIYRFPAFGFPQRYNNKTGK